MGLVKLDTNPLHVAAYKALGPKGIVAISKACEYRRMVFDRVKDIPTRLAAKQASFVNINANQPPLEQLASQMSSLQSGIVYKNQYQGQYNRKLYQGQRE